MSDVCILCKVPTPTDESRRNHERTSRHKRLEREFNEKFGQERMFELPKEPDRFA